MLIMTSTFLILKWGMVLMNCARVTLNAVIQYSKFHPSAWMEVADGILRRGESLRITLCYKKKSHVLWAISTDSGSWRPMKQSFMQRCFVSRQEGNFWPFEVSGSSYFVTIFSFVMVSMKILKIHAVCSSYQGEQLRFFHPYLYPKMRLKRWKNVI